MSRSKAGMIAAAIVATMLAGFLMIGAVLGVEIDAAQSCTIGPTAASFADVGAVVNDSGRLLYNHNADAENIGRSMSKALVLVALARKPGRPTAVEQRQAAAMIKHSDNAAASALVADLGLPAINAAARAAKMRDWQPDTSDPVYTLGKSRVSAADFAKLFARISSVLPDHDREWALGLLAHVEGAGALGALQAGIPGTVLSKAGWEQERGGWTVNQAAHINANGTGYGIAVVLGAQPSFQAGKDAIATIARAVYAALTTPPPAAGGDASGPIGISGNPGPGFTVRGPASDYGPPTEASGGTAYGRSSSEAGIALNPHGGDAYDDALVRSLGGKWFHVTVDGHSTDLQVIDKGPDARGRNGWRLIDITGAGVEQLGMDPMAFPTDDIATAVELPGPPRGQVDAGEGSAAAQGDQPGNEIASSPCGDTASTDTSGPLPLTAGDKTKILRDGLAAAGEDAPPEVKDMVRAGNRISDQPYLYGGGHGYTLDKVSPDHYDCSSAVSYLLHAGGALGASAMTSGELESWGAPGPGRYVTVYTNEAHVFMYVAGLRFDTSFHGTDTGPNAGEEGPRWRVLDHIPDWAPWVVRHPPGL